MEQLSFNQQGLAMRPVAVTGMPSQQRRAVARSRRREAACAGAEGNVTEIILPPGQVENFQLLLPMLTRLNREKRWLAWIDPPQALVSKWQKMHGIEAGQLLVLRSTDALPARQLAERALRAGTCHAVVVWTEKPGRETLASLQKASAEGNSHAVILRQR